MKYKSGNQLHMITNTNSIHKSDYILIVCSSLCYLFNYLYTPIVTLWGFIFLIVYYYSFFKYTKIEVCLLGIIIYRSIAIFLFPGWELGFNVALILFLYIPLLIFIRNRKWENIFRKYPYTLLFLVFSILSGVIAGTLNIYILKYRYFPLIVFLFFASVYHKELNYRLLLFYFRIIFLVTMLIYFLPFYQESTVWLLSDAVFGMTENPDIINNGITRNVGFCYDPRILGTYGNLYLLVALLENRKNCWFDISLSILVIFSTISRGAIVVTCFIFIGFIMQNIKRKKVILFLFFLGIVGLLIIESVIKTNSELEGIFNSFSLSSDNNALEQRSVFLLFALSKFEINPLLGIGAGALKGYEWFYLLGNKETYITDTFLMTTLAEIGIIGFVIFLLFQFELYYRKDFLSLFLLLGFLIQMLGTDVPDFGLPYFVIIYVVNRVLKK